MTQALGDALIHEAYGLKVMMDSFDDRMSLSLTDTNGLKVGLVAHPLADRPAIPASLVEDRDIIIVATGTGPNSCDIEGWWPTDLILESSVLEEGCYSINPRLLYEMPDVFEFEAPPASGIRIWDYSSDSWWVEGDVYLPSRKDSSKVANLDVEING